MITLLKNLEIFFHTKKRLAISLLQSQATFFLSSAFELSGILLLGPLIFIASSLVTSLYYTVFTFSMYSTSENIASVFFFSIIQYVFTSITFGTGCLLIYCMIQSLFGKYSKIPFLSDSLVWHIGDKDK